jgi:dTDP-4-amino-4,6-dideoxygalactose transaminase
MDYSVLEDFERALSKYTGAPYVVLTDSCTHAIELCLRYLKYNGTIILPNRTYLSVPMLIHKLSLQLYYDKDYEWQYEYRLAPTNIWDSARGLDRNMYVEGRKQCLSFGPGKRLEIGRGGAILMNNQADYIVLKAMANDGRNLHIKPWQDQQVFNLGFHYTMRLEEAIRGRKMLKNKELKDKKSQIVEYPDLLNIKIKGY